MYIPSLMNRFESFPVVKSFLENLEKVSDGNPISLICGVSGGIDSMVLLYLLHRAKVNCTVAHCNYQLRGEESEKDMRLVEEMSAMWGYDCVTARLDPDDAEESNTQIWARDMRYTMFRDLRQELNADFIATAHHKEDQVETILQKIFRGSGPAAWGGMDICDGDLFRPLLSVSKEEIRAFAQSQHVPFREDQTNRTSKYARNLIRNELAPDLDKLIPGWKQNVLQLTEKAEQFRVMTDMLLTQAEADSSSLNRKALLGLPKSIWPALIHRFIEKNGSEVAITSGELQQVNDLETLQTGSFLEFGEGLRLVRDRENFRLAKEETGDRQPQILIQKELPYRSDEYGIAIELIQWDGRIDQKILQLDAESFNWPVTLRPWRDGDRIQPLGMPGHKQVADLLTDVKISSVQKKDAILIESFDGIICAVIFPHITPHRQIGVISEIVKCTPATNKILRIDKDV